MSVRRMSLFAVVMCAAALGIGDAAAGFLVSERAYRLLAKAEQQVENEAFVAAVATLDRALTRKGMSDYERALFQRMAGAALINAGDPAAAAPRLQAAISGGNGEALPQAMRGQLRGQLAQIHLHEGKYQAALAVLSPWINAAAESAEPAEPSAEVCFLIASANAALERYPAAVKWGERGLSLTDAPAESQYALVAGLHLATSPPGYPRAAELLEHLIAGYPQTATHWRQLAAVYSQLNRPDRALAVAELGYLHGALTERHDHDLLARLYLHHNLPHKAAKLLDADRHEFDAARYRLLADAWVAAREYARALAPLQHAAALLRAAKNPAAEAEVRLLTGIAHAHLEQQDAAKRELQHCLNYPKTRTTAGQWLAYLAGE